MSKENNFGTGAIPTERNKMVASFSEIVADSPVFDWEKGFDIRKKVNLSLKDQNGSGSCGGQATAYLTEAIFGSEMSARSIYNKCYVPQSGSSAQGLMNTMINLGVDKETDTTSYENGKPPSEDFMRTPDSNPSVIKGLRPIYIQINFNKIADATLQCKGIILGIAGQDNGTWRSAEPAKPTTEEWWHWVYVGFVGMRKGKKCIGFKNSWGNVGENGWQYVYEDYLPHFFSAWSVIFTSDIKPKYHFTKTLRFGRASKDVRALQDILRHEGVFNNPSTGYYGPITASGVLAFQKKHKVAPVAELEQIGGKQVGPLTVKKLNQLYL